MAIFEKNNIFVIETQNLHYVLGVLDNGMLQHIHFGDKCNVDDYEVMPFSEENSTISPLDSLKTEYSTFGSAIFRETAFKATFADGCRDTRLIFDSSENIGNTLYIKLKDQHYPLVIKLKYECFESNDMISKSVIISNEGADDIIIEKMYSAEITMPSKNVYSSVNSNGCWGNEFEMQTTPVNCGELVYESRKGYSGHTNLPCFALSENISEDNGKVYFGLLQYSGNFKVLINRDSNNTTRAFIGINDFDFKYALKCDESFETPTVFCSVADGFTQMSNRINDFSLEYIFPENFRTKPLPVLYNSWESTEFDISIENQTKLAEIASKMGVEYFVMDDGWFGKRNSDRAGLGDWFVNKEKFPNGLKPLIDKVNSLGMQFGIWVEPEMVNADSDLFREHPDWAYHFDNRNGSELRNQLVLNVTRQDVKDYLFNCLDELLSENNIRYVKWDMNRPYSEVGGENLDCPQSVWYYHIMSVYDIVDRLKKKHPDIQFESCASGGGRCDLGAISHFDEVWTSDNTDPVDRLYIQNGYSLFYPRKAMRAWVTNSNDGSRRVALDYRFAVSMQGVLSIGSNLLKYTDEEVETCKKYIELYKRYRNVIQFGDLFRLADLMNNPYCITEYLDKEKKQGIVFICRGTDSLFKNNYAVVKMKGLEKDRNYCIDTGNKKILKSGAYFMNKGIDFKLYGACKSAIWIVTTE